MTPYELRFQIFKQAYNFAVDKYSASRELIENHNEISEKKWELPSFPSYEEVEEFAEKINNFISSK